MILLTRSEDAQSVRELVESAFNSRYGNLTKLLSVSSAAVAAVEEKRNVMPPDLVVAAWTQRSNALRIAGQYEEAEQALEPALELLPLAEQARRIECLEVQASLHRNTGRLESAARLLCAVLEAQSPWSRSPGAVRASNLLGIVMLDAGARARALQWFRTALDLAVFGTPADLVASAGHNLAETLLAEGRFEEASAALVSLEPLYKQLESARVEAKAEWLRARLCRAVDELAAARLAYERAHAHLSLEPRSPELLDLEAEMTGLGFPIGPGYTA
jgi:tetratricopeptide (TPR) repeat protein